MQRKGQKMANNPVVGKLNRDVRAGELVRLSDFHDQDLIAGVVKATEDRERRIGKAITKRKLQNLEKSIRAEYAKKKT